MRGSLNSRAEIAASANDRIRQVTIAKVSSTTPREGVDKPLEWKLAAPETTGDFSATCYYFARELQKTVDVPLGLIVSAWGGSKIEPWMSEDAIRSVAGYESALAVLGQYRVDPLLGAQRWGEYWQTWWRSQEVAGREPWASNDAAASWDRAPAELTPWETWGVPATRALQRHRLVPRTRQARQVAGQTGGDIVVRADRRSRPHVREWPRRGQFAMLWRARLHAAGRRAARWRQPRRRQCARHLHERRHVRAGRQARTDTRRRHQDSAGGVGIQRFAGSRAAARAVGANRGPRHVVQRDDRAARQIRASRRRCGTRASRTSRFPKAGDTRRSFARSWPTGADSSPRTFHSSSCSSPTMGRWPRCRWRAAGR